MKSVIAYAAIGLAVPGLIHAADAAPPVITHVPCATYRIGEPLRLRLRVEDASEVFEPVLVYRHAGRRTWEAAPLAPDGPSSYVVTLDASHLIGTVEYFVEVYDVHGNGPAQLGSVAAPLRVHGGHGPARCGDPKPTIEWGGGVPKWAGRPPPAAASPPVRVPRAPRSPCDRPVYRPLYCHPMLWIGVSAVVSATAGAAVYALTRSSATTSDRPTSPSADAATGPLPGGRR